MNKEYAQEIVTILWVIASILAYGSGLFTLSLTLTAVALFNAFLYLERK